MGRSWIPLHGMIFARDSYKPLGTRHVSVLSVVDQQSVCKNLTNLIYQRRYDKFYSPSRVDQTLCALVFSSMYTIHFIRDNICGRIAETYILRCNLYITYNRYYNIFFNNTSQHIVVNHALHNIEYLMYYIIRTSNNKLCASIYTMYI